MDITASDCSHFNVYSIKPLENPHLVETLFITKNSRQGFQQFLAQIKIYFSLVDSYLYQVSGENGYLQLLASTDKTYHHARVTIKSTNLQQAIIQSLKHVEQDKLLQAATLCIQQAKNHTKQPAVMSSVTEVKSGARYLLELKRNTSFSDVEQNNFQALLLHFNIALEIYNQTDQSKVIPTIEKIKTILPITTKEAINCQFIMQGKGLKEIAYIRSVSVHTVREQMRQVYLKTALHNQKKVISAIYEALR